jgi:hypothetical protein
MDGLEQVRPGEALELKWHGRHLAKGEFKRFDTAGSALGSDAHQGGLQHNLSRFYHGED